MHIWCKIAAFEFRCDLIFVVRSAWENLWNSEMVIYKTRNLFIDYIGHKSIEQEETLYSPCIGYRFPANTRIFHSLGGIFGYSYLSSVYFCYWMLSPKPTEGMTRGLYCLFCLQDAVQQLYHSISSEMCFLMCFTLVVGVFSSVSIKHLIWVLILFSEQTDSHGLESWDLKLFTSEFTILSFLKIAFIKKQRIIKIFRPVFRPFWTTGLWKPENWGARPCLSVSMSVLWDLGNLPSFQTWTLALSTLIPCRTKSVLFSIHTRTYTDTVSKEKIWAWRPAGRANIFSQYISSGLSGLAKKPT